MLMNAVGFHLNIKKDDFISKYNYGTIYDKYVTFSPYHNSYLLFIFFIKAQSFLELGPYLFSLSGVQGLCQDPVELYFGCQRQRGGTHDNPTAAEFYKNAQALRVVNSFCKTSPVSNCRGSMADSVDAG